MRHFFARHHVLLSVVVALSIGLLATLLMPSVESAGPASLAAAGVLLGLMRYAVAIAALFIVLRVMDIAAGFKWSEISDAISNNPLAIAVYLCGRLIAFSLIAFGCFS